MPVPNRLRVANLRSSMLVCIALTAIAFGLAAQVTSAHATVTAAILSQSSYMSSTYLNIVGEVQNTGTDNLEFVKVTVNFYDSGGTLVGTDYTYTEAWAIAPGEKSPFREITQPPPGYDHYYLFLDPGSAASRPNHQFTVCITNVYSDSFVEHIVGTVTNNNTTTATYVKPIFTFYNGGGTVVDEDYTYVNTNSTSDISPGQTVAFDEQRLLSHPVYTSRSVFAESSLSPPTSGTTVAAPSAPTNVAATSGDHSAAVTWSAPTGCSGPAPVTSYTITAVVSGSEIGGQTIFGSPPATAASFATLTNGTTYSFKVRASNSGGTGAYSTLSNQVVPIGLPGPPTSVFATGGDGTASVSWSPPADNGGAQLSGYTVRAYSHGLFQTAMSVSGGPPSPNATLTSLPNGVTYTFLVVATNPAGTGPASGMSNSITTTSFALPPARTTAASSNQYQLPNSDGVLWQDMDAASLSLSITPGITTQVLLSANSDLWTADAGFNQDIGIFVSPTDTTSYADNIVAWKESGGLGGTYSPNAAYVQAVVTLNASIPYTIKLRWKANRSAIGATIYAGAGPIGGNFSPTRLSAVVLPSTALMNASGVSQYALPNSDGVTWQEMDSALRIPFTAATNGTVLLGANSDLWTANSGYNQDIGIFESVNGGPDQLVAWKESGGSAGTYSPNAAFAQATVAVSTGGSYLFKIKWKTNRPAVGATIFAGAGPINQRFSSTRLTATILATGSSLTFANTSQYSLNGNNGVDWQPIDSRLDLTVSPSASGTALVTANCDLWTATAGFNQDIGIFVSVNGAPDQLLAWKESGGFAGTFSPNAAFAETMYSVSSGNSYIFRLKWKTNRSAGGATIFAGAGPIGQQFSPTRLTYVGL